MGDSVWHTRTLAGDQCLQQDQPGMALIHYLAAMEQARYWIENLTDIHDEQQRIDIFNLFMHSCINLSRYWYIQSEPQEQQRYLLEANQYREQLTPEDLGAHPSLRETLTTYYQLLRSTIKHHPDVTDIETLRQVALELEQQLGTSSSVEA